MGIFTRKGATVTSTGHAGDDQLLADMARHEPLDLPRHWVHYLSFADEDAARTAAAHVLGRGWNLQRVGVATDGGPQWVVVAEKFGAVTDHRSVQEARVFFEGIAASQPGGDYDGWEASV